MNVWQATLASGSLILVALLGTSCGNSQSESQSLAAAVATQTAPQDLEALVTALKAHDFAVPLRALPANLRGTNLTSGAADLVVSLPVKAHQESLTAATAATGLWLMAPESDDELPAALPAFSRDGRKVMLATAEAPDELVFVIGRPEGQLPPPAAATPQPLATPEGTGAMDELLMLQSVRFTDIKEPWFRGEAEVYALVAYLDRNGKGHAEVVPLWGVTKAETTYDLRKVLHYWPQNYYTLVDISFFEQDTNHNYQELAVLLMQAATEITAVALPQFGSIVALVGGLLQKVIAALPSGAFDDRDDHLDTINTVERQPDFVSRVGVAGNGHANFRQFQAYRHP